MKIKSIVYLPHLLSLCVLWLLSVGLQALLESAGHEYEAGAVSNAELWLQCKIRWLLEHGEPRPAKG